MLTVTAWHDGIYLANIEENLNEVNWVIKYEDHGDTFFVVSIDNKLYAYGWWENRYDFHPVYIREPESFAKKASWCNNPCKLPYEIKYINDHYSTAEKCKKLNPEFAQWNFNEIIKGLDKAYSTGYEYNWSYYKFDIAKFLKDANIDTLENEYILENAHWTSVRKNGTKGIAAKKDYTNYCDFSCDAILSIFHNGQWHDTEYNGYEYNPKNVYRNIPYEDVEFDDWGFFNYTYSFNTINNELNQMVLF